MGKGERGRSRRGVEGRNGKGGGKKKGGEDRSTERESGYNEQVILAKGIQAFPPYTYKRLPLCLT